MSTPLISIIIPTYNRAHLIEETIDSILAQTYTNWECLIVDDGSIDNTDEVLQTYLKDTRFQYHKRPSNKLKGPNACRNFGFELSKGEFIKWFDSDDILLKDALEYRINSFQDNVDVVIGKAEFFDSDSRDILFCNEIMSTNMIEDYFIGNITFYVSGPVWRRNFLLENDLYFDEEIRYLDDWDFNLRALYKNPSIVFLSKIVFLYRSHELSLSKQVNFLNIEELKSEYLARNKHYFLLKKHKMLTEKINYFMLNRYKNILRSVLVTNEKSSSFFYYNLLRLQLQNTKVGNAVKNSLGFFSYKIFKKGYILFK